MKYIVLSIGLLGTSLGLAAQKKPAPKVAAPKPPVAMAPAKTILKNLTDSASYAFGENFAQSLKKDFGGLNPDLVALAIKNVFQNKTPLFDEMSGFQVYSQYSAKVNEEKSKKIIEEGQAFLDKNKQKPDIHTTASGLQYEIVKQGSGLQPGPEDTVVCHYRGTLLDGTEFDASYNRGEPLTIQVAQVIKGWNEGLQLMHEGATYKFYIPYNLGYGLRGSPPDIPGGATLIFEVELLSVKKKI